MVGIHALGYLGNEAERVSCALHELRGTLKAPEGTIGFGLAHYVDDRLLLNLKPAPVAADTSLEELVGPLKTSTLLGNFHVEAEAGPYKFRTWAFAMRGGGTAGEDLASRLTQGLPDMLRRNMAGDSVAEAAFHRFLDTLQEEARLEDPMVPAKAVDVALKKTLDALHSAGDVLLLVSNGRFVAGIHNGLGLAYNLREGVLACQRCAMDKHAMDNFPLRESHRRYRGVMLVGGLETPPPGFLPVPIGQTLSIGRKLEVVLH